MDRQRFDALLAFLEVIDRLKSVYRAAYIADGSRHESVAEHVWHACMFALLLHGELERDVDLARTIELLLVHDLVEVFAGDAPLHDEAARAGKAAAEAAAAERLFGLLPGDLSARLRDLWEEFETAATPEARFANELDRLQAIAQNLFAGGRTWEDWEVTEELARTRNRAAIGFEPELAEAFEEVFLRARRLGLFWPHPEC